jgi:phage/plasmid primase-like uncharacterized protein
VDVAGAPVSVHRTFVADGRKASIEPAKASLGPAWGGAIRLAEITNGETLVVAEGLETAASAGRLLGGPAWAAVAAGNLAQGLRLPPHVNNIIIAADADPAGQRAAQAAAARWRDEGRRVKIAKPDAPGRDFNDLLLARSTRR